MDAPTPPPHAPDLPAVFAALPSATAVLAPDAPRFTVLLASDAMLAAAGRGRGEIVGRPFAEAFPSAEPGGPGDGLTTFRDSLEAAVRAREPRRLARHRHDVRRADGGRDERYWDVVSTPVLGPDGEVRCVVHQTEDVTARVLEERAQASAEQRAEQRAERVLERVSDAHVVLDREFRFLTVNSAAERVLAKSRGEMLGRTHWDVFPASVDADAGRAYRRVVAEGVEEHLTQHYVGEGYDVHLEIDAYPTDEGGVAIFWRDVTTRRKVEAENAQLASLVRAAGEAMLGVSRDGVVESWNPAAERLFGYTSAEMIGTPVSRLAPPGPLGEELGLLAAAHDGLTASRETVCVTKDGRHVDVILTVGCAASAAGEPAGVSAVIVDITERNRTAAALELERERLADVFRQAPVAIVLLRGRHAPDLVFDLVNPRYVEMLPPGRAPLGRRLRDVLPELDAALVDALQGVLDTGAPFMATDHHMPLDRDGDGAPEDYYFNFVYHPLREAGGAVVGVVGVGAEVTESVRARQRAEALLASIADAFYLLDREWRFTHVNDAAEPLLQTTRDQLLGRTLWEAFPGVIGSVFEGPYREAMAAGRVTSAEAYFDPLGTWFDVHSYPWSGGLMVHFRDIGDRKAAEAERERLLAAAEIARADAEAANRAKSEFLAVMSHELRTPLNAIGGYAELMEMGIRGPVTSQQRDDLRRVQTSQRHLLGLINEVLNYAKLETGAVHYAVDEVRVRDALFGAEALVAPQAQAKSLALVVDPGPPALAVRADAEKLRQVLVNLLSNAVKFTDRGGRVELAAAADGDRVRVVVRDTGIGIAPDQLDRIFEPFVQVRADLTRTAEGTGLGLAISRDLARGMGGDLVAESAAGAGSTFTLTLPRG